MNISRTTSPLNARPQSLASQPKAEGKDTVTLFSNDTVEISRAQRPSTIDTIAKHAGKVLGGAASGLAIGMVSNGIGPVGATFANGAASGVLGGVDGYLFGKKIGQKTEDAQIESQLKRHFATRGALNGLSDGLMEGGIVAGLTALTGGNLAVGMAAGVAVRYLL